MNSKTMKLILYIDDRVVRHIVKWLYPQYHRPRYGYMLNISVLLRYAIVQKIFRINGNVPWPVDFRSKVTGWRNIKKVERVGRKGFGEGITCQKKNEKRLKFLGRA